MPQYHVDSGSDDVIHAVTFLFIVMHDSTLVVSAIIFMVARLPNAVQCMVARLLSAIIFMIAHLLNADILMVARLLSAIRFMIALFVRSMPCNCVL